MVDRLTSYFQNRFEYFFGANSDFFNKESKMNAVHRLEEMAEATLALADQPFSLSDKKFGVHGGHRNRDGSEMKGGVQFAKTQLEPPFANNNDGAGVRRKLFYCGGAKGLERKQFRYSTFGLFLANSLFPEVEGKAEIQPGKVLVNTATPLTSDTLPAATVNDIAIIHSHQVSINYGSVFLYGLTPNLPDCFYHYTVIVLRSSSYRFPGNPATHKCRVL